MDESVHNVWCWEWKGEVARGRKDGSREAGEGTESQTEEMKGKKEGKGQRCGKKGRGSFPYLSITFPFNLTPLFSPLPSTTTTPTLYVEELV